MARITVEDCLNNVDNRFELVLLATKRARELERGADPKVKWENDKPTVVALREIAEGLLNKSDYETNPTVKEGSDEQINENSVEQSEQPAEQ